MDIQVQKYGIGIINTVERMDSSGPLDCSVSSDSLQYDFLPLQEAKEKKKYAKFIKNNLFFYKENMVCGSSYFLYVPPLQKGRLDIFLKAEFPAQGVLLLAIDKDTSIDIVEHSDFKAMAEVYVDIVAISGSRVEYTKQVDANEFQVQTSHRAKIMAESSVTWNEYIKSTKNALVNVESYLEQPGATSHTKSIIYSLKEGVCDVKHEVFHNSVMTNSHISAAGIAKDESKNIYRSCIDIKEGAKRSSGHQKAQFLQLSPKAEVDAVPALQVECHEVFCSHGVSITRCKPEDIFYITSRGIESTQAENILERAHVCSIIDSMNSTAQAEFDQLL